MSLLKIKQNTGWTVPSLFPQAGGDGGQLVSVVPAGLTRLFQHPTLDWNLFSARQQPLTDREVREHRYSVLQDRYQHGGCQHSNTAAQCRAAVREQAQYLHDSCQLGSCQHNSRSAQQYSNTVHN